MNTGYIIKNENGLFEIFSENWTEAVETAMEMSVLYGEAVDIFPLGSNAPCWQVPAFEGDD